MFAAATNVPAGNLILVMKSHLEKLILGASLFVSAFSLAFGQGTLIIQHFGDTDPTTEGFTLGGGSTGQVGGITNDLGFNAWSTTVANSSVSYYCSIENLTGLDWELTGTIRIVSSNTIPGVFNLYLSTGLEQFEVKIGSDANGNPIVAALGSSLSPVYVLNNAGSTYNTYQLLYDAASDTADLYINGVEQMEDIVGDTYFEFPPQPQLSWGGGNQGPTSQANWNMVSLEIVPEPLAIFLLFLGGGVFIYVRRIYRMRHNRWF
jgi:hypothetical protein